MLYKVTHCAERVSANIRPHQLCWGDRKMGTPISCIEGSQMAGLIQKVVENPRKHRLSMCLWSECEAPPLYGSSVIWHFNTWWCTQNTWWNNLQFIHRTAIYTTWKIYRCIPYTVLEHVAMETEILNHASALSNCKPQKCASLHVYVSMEAFCMLPKVVHVMYTEVQTDASIPYKVCEVLRKSNHKQRHLHTMKSHQEMSTVSSSPDFAISLVGKRLYIG